MARGSLAKQVRSRIMIIMEQLHETESLPMHVHYGTTAHHYVTTACVPGAVSAARSRYNEGGWIGATAQRKSRRKTQKQTNASADLLPRVHDTSRGVAAMTPGTLWQTR